MKKKTEIAVKITDKNREKVRCILDMFGERYYKDTFNYEDIIFEHNCNRWGGSGDIYENQITYVKPKELRNILAVEYLKEGDVIIATIGKGAKYIVKFKNISNRSNGAFIDAEKYITIYSDGEMSDTIVEGGSFPNFLRYATEEEKSFLEPKKELPNEGEYWIRTTGCVILIQEYTDCHGGTVKCTHINNTDHSAFHHINTLVRKLTPKEVEKALIKESSWQKDKRYPPKKKKIEIVGCLHSSQDSLHINFNESLQRLVLSNLKLIKLGYGSGGLDVFSAQDKDEAFYILIGYYNDGVTEN